MKFLCKKCGGKFSIQNFYEIKFGKPARYCCKRCWYLFNLKYLKPRDLWGYQIKRKYGLSKNEYLGMLDKQNGKCAICGCKSKKRLSIDHCHKTEKIRGLLCDRCNPGIGYFSDSIKILTRAIAYLR